MKSSVSKSLKSYYGNNEDTNPLELNAGVQHLEGLTEVESVTNEEDNTTDVVVAGVATVSFADADPAIALSQAKRNFKLFVDRVRAVLQDEHTFSKLNMDEKQRLDADCLNSSEETSKKEYEYRREMVEELADTIKYRLALPFRKLKFSSKINRLQFDQELVNSLKRRFGDAVLVLGD
ncbi:hypothetical protein K7432_015434 [Basidiobolus ranarum]|uniref:Uncharacterized protein n=1 Tax=Basidiobolus ranarum TaxID=34480 RepID=A0ABR2WG52_9FUNG